MTLRCDPARDDFGFQLKLPARRGRIASLAAAASAGPQVHSALTPKKAVSLRRRDTPCHHHARGSTQ